jgi:hypothetical protein
MTATIKFSLKVLGNREHYQIIEMFEMDTGRMVPRRNVPEVLAGQVDASVIISFPAEYASWKASLDGEAIIAAKDAAFGSLEVIDVPSPEPGEQVLTPKNKKRRIES